MRVKSKKIFDALRRYATYIVFGTNIIAIILLFCSYLTWEISPSKAIIFAYTGLGFPVILVINIVYVVLWFILLKWKLGLVGIISLAICWNPIYTYFPVNMRTKEIPQDCFKMLTYNVRGFTHEWRGNAMNNKVVGYINNSEADIVCMQEFTYYGEPGPKMDRVFKTNFPDYPYYSMVNFSPSLRGVIHGGVCLSKYPITHTEKIAFDEEASGNGSILYRINMNGKTISLVLNHLQSNRLTAEDKKLYKDFIRDTKAESLDSVARNITSRLGIAYEERSHQVDNIAKVIASEKTDAMLVCGDFNDPPISYSYKKIKGDLIDSYRETGFGMGITYNEKLFWFRIDYIFHSKNMEAYNCTVDKVKYSDHYPIWTYLRFRDENKQ